MGDVHPIVGLKPALEKQYGQRGFNCWIKLEDRKIEVQPPVGLVLDELGRRRLGAIALVRYLDLAKQQSQVERAVVLPARGDSVAPIEVSRSQAELMAAVQEQGSRLVETASVAAGTTLTLTLVAPGLAGALVVLEGAPNEAAARRAAKAALAAGSVSAVRLPLPQGVIVQGPDASFLERPASVAPVRS